MAPPHKVSGLRPDGPIDNRSAGWQPAPQRTEVFIAIGAAIGRIQNTSGDTARVGACATAVAGSAAHRHAGSAVFERRLVGGGGFGDWDVFDYGGRDREVDAFPAGYYGSGEAVS